jgi:hypothetical protein
VRDRRQGAQAPGPPARTGRARQGAAPRRPQARSRLDAALRGTAARAVAGCRPIAAGRRALETPGLDQAKRTHIEELIHTLEQEKARGPELDLDAANDRSIAIEFDDPLAPPPEVARAKSERDPNADSGFELSLDGSLVEGDTGVDLANESSGELGAPPPAVPSVPAAPDEPTQPLPQPPSAAQPQVPAASAPQTPATPAPIADALPSREAVAAAPPLAPDAPPASEPSATKPPLASVAPIAPEPAVAAPPSAPVAPPPLPQAPAAAPSAQAPPTPPPLASPAPTLDARPAEPSADDVALNTAAQEPTFQEIKVVEGSPIALGADQIDLAQPDGRRGRVPFSQIQAVAVGAVHGLSAKPVILIDLVVNWNSAGDGPLRAVRLRSDRFDARRLAPEAGGPMDAIRALLAALLDGSGALPLPDPESGRGRPVRIFPDLATYERSVLKVAG